MASESLTAAKRVPSRNAFFTPVSSASWVEEFENQPPCALPHSVAFPHSKYMLRSERTGKEVPVSLDRSPVFPLASELLDFLKGPEHVVHGREAPHVATECRTSMLLNVSSGSLSDLVDSRGALPGGSALLRCTAPVAACVSNAVQNVDRGCTSRNAPAEGGGSVANVKKSVRRQALEEKERSSAIGDSDSRDLGSPFDIPPETRTPLHRKGAEVFGVTKPAEGSCTSQLSLVTRRDFRLNERRRCASGRVDATDHGTGRQRQFSTSMYRDGLPSGSPSSQLLCNLLQDQTCVGSTQARTKGSGCSCPLVKAVSTASTTNASNEELLHAESSRRRGQMIRCAQHQTLNLGEVSVGKLSKDISDKDESGGARPVIRPYLAIQTTNCGDKVCDAPANYEGLAQGSQPAARDSCSHEPPSGQSTAMTGNPGTVSDMPLQHLDGRCGADSSAHGPASSESPTRTERVRRTQREETEECFYRELRFKASPTKTTENNLLTRIRSVPSGYRGGLSAKCHRPLHTAARCSFTESGLGFHETPHARVETKLSRTTAACTDGTDEPLRSEESTKEKTSPRITPISRNFPCVVKPPFPVASTHLLTARNTSGERDGKQERAPRRICAAVHRRSFHIRKARRCTERAECIRAFTTSENSVPAIVNIRGQLVSRAAEAGCEPAVQKPPTPDTLMPVGGSPAASSRDNRQQPTAHRCCPSNILLPPERITQSSLNRPSVAEQVVKSFGDRLSAFERQEILNYEEVWYWGSRRVAHPEKVHKSSETNSGFDDPRGDYLVILGDHIRYRYEIIAPLGRGSFGQVFKAVDHKRREQVALKIVRNKRHFHVQGRVEVDVLRELLHHDGENKAHVIHMKEHFLFRGHLVITFELLSMNVYEFLKQNSFRGLSSLAVRSIAIQLLLALRLLRKQRIVHCDLKPENIVLKNVRKSGIKLIDFGSSCREGDMPYSYIQSRFYRSPEVLLGLKYDCAIDMWSLGCVLAELQTGQPLFPGVNEVDQMNCIMELLGPPPDHLISQSPKRDLFFNDNGEPKISVSPNGNKRKISSRDFCSALRTDDMHFVGFIRGCLQWDPAGRMNPDEAMQQLWIKEFKALRHRKRLSAN